MSIQCFRTTDRHPVGYALYMDEMMGLSARDPLLHQLGELHYSNLDV